MKYAIVNDEIIETYLGGAALVNDKIKTELEENGHDCDILLFNARNKDKPVQKEWNEYDVYILANIAYCPQEFIMNIIENKKYISFRHDIPVVLYTAPKSIFHEGFYNVWERMFENSVANIFISPMQLDVFKSRFPEVNSTTDKNMILPPPLDISSFKDEQRKDRNGCLYVGDINEARGCSKTLQMMKQQFPDNRYTFVGKITDPTIEEKLIGNGATVINTIAHDDMSDLMNDYKYLFYYPNIYDSFCLKILEAELCGLKVFADTYCIGLYSYPNTVNIMKTEIETGSLLKIINICNNIVI